MVTPKTRRWASLAARYLILTVLAIVLVYPFLFMIATSFKTRTASLGNPFELLPTEPTLENYARALGEENFGLYFFNSVLVATASTFFIVLLSSMMAYGFTRFRFPGRRLLFALIIAGLTIPTMMLIIPQFILAKDLRLLDSLPGLVPFYVGTALGFNTFLLCGFFETIPRELDEAMLMDGAGAWRRYFHLALPLSKPALATVVIFSSHEPRNEKITTVAIALFHGQHSTSWGLVFAASVIAIIPVLIVYITFQRFFVAGITTGAVKS
ncbi:MAG: carbohydrate ABC transporter permease [Microbacterium sp.]|nr:MAG: carbohydrate ABC transporter permease [Microbacterium sp.]